MINENKNKKKHNILIILCLFALIGVLGGLTYAFFNYTRTGNANTLKVGRMSFGSRQTNTINLVNLFPIDPTNTSDMNDNTKVGTLTIEIEGDTDYSEGVEYLISTVNSSITTNGKVLPISLNVTINGLGTSSDSYWTARESKNATIYKKLVGETLEENQMILVGYIKPNNPIGTAEGIDGSITIKAYLDENKILISDTYNNGEEPTDNMGTPASLGEGKTVFTTSEWNALQSSGVSFQVNVEANEGIWVEKPSAFNTIKKNVDTTTQINFANTASASNGEGLYILLGTENDTNPIYYYRGAVDNNNVIFGDYCWQMVRTTNTGGIKMIYNGVVTGTSEEPTCENTTHASRIISSSAFNSSKNSMSDVGYMSNARYPVTQLTKAPASGTYFGASVEYGEYDINNPGTNVYRLVDDGNGSVGTTLDAAHHYSCNVTTSTGTCETVRYYYNNSGSIYDYINLTGGELVEDAIYKMTGNIVNPNIDVVTRNSGYVLNQNDSTAKGVIESWFRTNLTNEVDNTKTDYRPYLEDTIFCNDRSIKTVVGNTSYVTYPESGWGWNPNGGVFNKRLNFGTYNRIINNWYSTTNVPSVACPNETDRFSVGSSVAHLNYPVGLLTADEIVMAGVYGTKYTQNRSIYLITGGTSWSLSPNSFDNFPGAGGFCASDYGSLNGSYVNFPFGLRPSVSLKPGTEFEKGGDGTPTKPYIVKYE